MVVVHSADNAFTNWKEFTETIGVGGWGGRTEKSGRMFLGLWEWKMDPPLMLPGPTGHHGPPHPDVVVTRD